MSLNYDLTNVQHRDTSDAAWARTESIIWACMALGMSGIAAPGTTTNRGRVDAGEFWIRLRILRKMGGYGPLLTWLDVLNHVGLSTNVTQESRKTWLKRMTDGLEREEGYLAVRDSIELDARRELLIKDGKLAPAAREMAWPELEWQYREVNALDFAEARKELLGE